MKWKVAAVIVLLAIGGGAVAFAITGGLGGGATSGPTWITAAATTTDVAETAVANGTLERATTFLLDFGSAPTVAVGGSTSGSAGGSTTWPVTEVMVEVGDTVTKGATLAVADATALGRDLTAARASLSAAKTQKAIANTQLDDADTTDQTRQARIAVQNAIAQLSQAQGRVADLEAQIARATIVAPADGTILEVNVVAGTNAPSSHAIVLASGPLRVTAGFAEGDLPVLKTGQAATVRIEALDTSVEGTVVRVAPSASTSTGGSSVVTYAVTIELGSPPAEARPGMTAQASITTSEASGVLAVPAVALSGSGGAYQVMVVGADGTVQARDVTVGLVTSSLAEIRSGLSEGERVVIGTTATRQGTSTGTGGFPGFPGGGLPRGTGGGGGTPVAPGGQP